MQGHCFRSRLSPLTRWCQRRPRCRHCPAGARVRRPRRALSGRSLRRSAHSASAFGRQRRSRRQRLRQRSATAAATTKGCSRDDFWQHEPNFLVAGPLHALNVFPQECALHCMLCHSSRAGVAELTDLDVQAQHVQHAEDAGGAQRPRQQRAEGLQDPAALIRLSRPARTNVVGRH